MKFKTSISTTKNGEHAIRGHNIVELLSEHSFAEVILLLLRGDLGTANEAKLLEAMLVASVENGIEAPSVYVPRIVAASGNDMHVALAASCLAIGSKHGGAAESCATLLASDKTPDEIVNETKTKPRTDPTAVGSSTRVLPGFGHKIYKDADPRTTALYEKTKQLGFAATYFEKGYAIERALAAKKGKKLPLNIDGAIAATLLELKLDPRLGKALFMIARLVGASAHVLEELNQDNSYYRLEESDAIEA